MLIDPFGPDLKFVGSLAILSISGFPCSPATSGPESEITFFVPWLRCNFDAFVIIFLALIAGFYTILHDLFLQLLTNSLLLVLVWAALISVFTGNLFFSLRVFNFVDLPCFPGLFCFLLLFSISHSLVDYRLWFFLTLTSNHVYFRLWLFHKFL